MNNNKPNRILVVDDNDAGRYIVVRILLSAGFQVLEATTAHEAFQKTKDEYPDLLILDVNLPDMSGYEVCKRLKANPATDSIPILHLSAKYSEAAGQSAGLEGVADGYLLQPVDPLVLKATVKALLRIRRAEEERAAVLKREQLALAAARLEKEKMKTLFLQVPACVLVLRGPDHVLELANPEARRVLTLERYQDRKIGEVLSMSWAELLVPLLNQVYATGKSYHGSEVAIEQEYFNFVLSPLFGSLGEIEGIFAFAYEVSEQVRSRNELQSAVRIRDEFLSIASHELRTPLTSLKLQTQSRQRRLLKSGDAGFSNQDLLKMISKDDRQITRLSQLVDDMLDISQISAGKLVMTRERFDLCDLVQEVVERISLQASLSGCEITVKVSGPVMGEWDRHRIEQSIINLLTNAIKYGACKPIEVVVGENGEIAFFKVRDFGMGISKEDQSRIFERFERAISVNEVSGLGLGLYIVSQIMAAHSGVVSVESELGKGSIFTIELPKHPTLAVQSAS